MRMRSVSLPMAVTCNFFCNVIEGACGDASRAVVIGCRSLGPHLSKRGLDFAFLAVWRVYGRQAIETCCLSVAAGAEVAERQRFLGEVAEQRLVVGDQPIVEAIGVDGRKLFEHWPRLVVIAA